MFFRRMFAQKDVNGCDAKTQERHNDNKSSLRNKHNSYQKKQQQQSRVNCLPLADQYGSAASSSSTSFPVFQLTPLWEYVLRKRKLPENVCPVKMFDEFSERFRDPEWQVRQHALRVFVDVLIVLGTESDNHMSTIVPQLVENLGHPAPTVRKGALDCLRVYLSKTAMPETILLQILDIGFKQENNESFGGGKRLACGVMLSLPALVQSTLHTPKRNFILRTTIDMLTEKMRQVMHQEITLKVLSKLCELIGVRQFQEFLTPNAFREFGILCNIYDIGTDLIQTDASYIKSWRRVPSSNQSENIWQSSENECRKSGKEVCEKVIMETEIKINENTLTMRILEAKDDDDCSEQQVPDSPNKMESSFEEDFKSGGIVRILSDSEIEEINVNNQPKLELNLPETPRTPKRVTFGGEIVKMRTPDSDVITPVIEGQTKIKPLTIHIADDNTISIPRIESDKKEIHDKESTESSSAKSSKDKEKEAASSPFKGININPVDSIISPKAPHKEIEVLHNLQRDPSPARLKRTNTQEDMKSEEQPIVNVQQNIMQDSSEPVQNKTRSWEELGIVSDVTIINLRCGDWRQRSNGIHSLEEALRSTEILALVQPFLESLLRTLLSSERHPDVAEDKRRIVMNLISRLPLDNLENRTVQILTGLCRQGGPGSNRICKALMQRLPPAAIVLKLISGDFLHAKSSRFRENALQMVMYALTTFPSTCFDIETCITNATFAALDRKKRVRQAALEVLAILGQVTSPRHLLDIVESIAITKDTGRNLIAAVKARLSRKQLPIVSPDGTVQFILRLPSPQPKNSEECAVRKTSSIRPDIEWISAGIGSVSPTSLKRRKSKKYRENCCMYDVANNCYERTGGEGVTYPHQMVYEKFTFDGEAKEACDNGLHCCSSSALVGEEKNHYKNINNNMMMPTGFFTGFRPCGGECVNLNGRRLGIKSCSDSSMDGRSSDSTTTYTSSNSSGSGGTASTVDIAGHFTSKSINSRFPTMERIDLTSINNNSKKREQSHQQMPMMAKSKTDFNCYGPFHQKKNCKLNSTYPKVNFSERQQQQPTNSFKNHHQFSHRSHPAPQEAINHESRFNEKINELEAINSRRFVNMEKQKTHRPSSLENVTPSIECLDQSKSTISDIDESSTTHVVITSSSLNLTPLSRKLEISSKPFPKKMARKQCSRKPTRNFSRFYIFNKSHPSTSTLELNSSCRMMAPPSTIQLKSPLDTKCEEEETNKDVIPNIELRNGLKATTEVDQIVHTSIVTTSKKDGTIVQAQETSVVQTNTDFDEINISASPSTSSFATKDTIQIEDLTDSVIPMLTEAETEDLPATFNAEAQEEEEEEEEVEEIVRPPSAQSKTESIKTLLEDTLIPLSRAQSVQSTKSLIIEEELDEGPSNSLSIDDSEHENISEVIHHETIDEVDCNEHETSTTPPPNTTSCLLRSSPNTCNDIERSPVLDRTYSPTIEEIKSKLKMKNIEVIINEIQSDNGIESSTQTPEQVTNPDNNYDFVPCGAKVNSNGIKLNSTPLRHKNFRSVPRISPVKQSIKMVQPELFPQSMTRFEKPRDALHKTFDSLDSPHWELVVNGLKSMVRMIRYHSDTLDQQMHMVCIQLTKSVRNLRSQVSRAACQASTELFTIKSKFLEQECDDLVCALLHRTADTNRFLRIDAHRALESMCDSLTATKVLNLLTIRGAQHQNSLVRTTAAKLLNRLADRLGCEKIFSMNRENRDKFFITGANLLMEGSLETRSHAKSLFQLLSEHPNYLRVLLEIIPLRTYRNIERTLKSIR